LTGQRREEIGGLRWSEIELECEYLEWDNDGHAHERTMPAIKLPPQRCKNGRSMIEHGIEHHIVPLSDQALDIIKSVPRGDRDLVFGNGAGGYGGYTCSGVLLDARIAESTDKPMKSWTVHDLRRTFISHVKERRAFAEPHVVHAITNHLSGYKPGIVCTYDKALYLPERRKTLQLWGAYVARLVARPVPQAGAAKAASTRSKTAGAGLVV
jgi:integrase